MTIYNFLVQVTAIDPETNKKYVTRVDVKALNASTARMSAKERVKALGPEHWEELTKDVEDVSRLRQFEAKIVYCLSD